MGAGRRSRMSPNDADNAPRRGRVAPHERSSLVHNVSRHAEAECAAEQNRFWPYHDLLFERQGAENSGVFSQERLKGYARGVGLDGGRFDECFDGARYAQKVADDRAEGIKQGVSATPSVFVGDEKLPGVPTREALFGAI